MSINGQVQYKVLQMCLHGAILVDLKEKELSSLVSDHELPANMMIFVLAWTKSHSSSTWIQS